MEVPWWTYGGRGMQLWFPSALAEPLSPRAELASKSVDPELEFDKEVYPIGISLAEVAIIGTAIEICILFGSVTSEYSSLRVWL